MSAGSPEAGSFSIVEKPPYSGGMMVLELLAPNYPPRKVYIKSPRCVVGSGPDCTLRLVAEGVEPVHCVIIRSERQIHVERVAPQTWLNQREFHTALFRPGDRLQLGPIQIQLIGTGPAPKPLSNAPGIAAHGSAPKPTVSAPTSPVSVRKPTGAEASVPSGGEGISGGLAASGASAPFTVGKTSPRKDQIVRQLGHRRVKRLIALLREARQQTLALQTQMEQLRHDLDAVRSQQERLRTLSEQGAELEAQSRRLADWENRLLRHQAELQQQAAHLEAQRYGLERQWAQWQAQHAQVQQQLQRQAQALQQQQAELQQTQQSFQAELQKLQAQQEVLRQQQMQQQQALQAQEELLARKRQELADWQQRLETQTQALAQREAALAETQQALQHQRDLLEQEQQHWQDQKAQLEATVPEATVPEDRFERYTRAPEPRSASSTEEILRRLGMMPLLEEEAVQGTAPPQQPEIPTSTSPTSRGEPSPPDSSEQEEGIIHAYMERLLGRSWQQTFQTQSAEAEGETRNRFPAEKSALQKEEKEEDRAGSVPSRPERARRRGTAEWVPRAVAPERGVNLEAMRDLANLSAHSALEHHQRRKTWAAVWAKFLATVFSLLLGCGMLWLWGGNPEHDVALYAAGVCFAVAALWGVQYLLLAGKLILRTIGFGRSGALPLSPTIQESCSEGAPPGTELPTSGYLASPSSEGNAPSTNGHSPPCG